ncbi:uncharacterized protein LOC130735713 [Lotus japonicus]|uniref:uncharacterized protein LOC130735713 n=1 Tax=Lotus japonicus TaxID=34305 RepID=UPI002585AC83|nr:uncharacterized protein LOC130735713 [Lotus japonicus]
MASCSCSLLPSPSPQQQAVLAKTIIIQTSLCISSQSQYYPHSLFRLRSRSSQTLRLFISPRKSKTKLQAHQRDFGPDWPILRRWEVPWQWQTFSLTSIACALSLVLTVWLEVNALQSLEVEGDELSSDEEAVIFLVNHSFATAIVLQVLYGITNMYQPLPQDFFKYDWREPFNLQKGWLLWGGVGLAGALIVIALPGAAMSFFSEESQETSTRKTDTLVRLLPVGSSYVRTACVMASTGLLAPLLEETVFRGFVMASLTKWVPTPVAVLISAAVFSLCHFTPGVFPWLFVLGTFLGISYAQTRNLLTPITIHAFWNIGLLILTLLQW